MPHLHHILNDVNNAKQKPEVEIKVLSLFLPSSIKGVMQTDAVIPDMKRQFLSILFSTLDMSRVKVRSIINCILDRGKDDMLVKMSEKNHPSKYYRKHQFAYPVYLHRANVVYKFTFAYEDTIQASEFTGGKLAFRLKLRIEIPLGKFRLDITLVKTLKNTSKDELKLATKRIFPNTVINEFSIDTFLEYAPIDECELEVEMEYVGNINIEGEGEGEGEGLVTDQHSTNTQENKSMQLKIEDFAHPIQCIENIILQLTEVKGGSIIYPIAKLINPRVSQDITMKKFSAQVLPLTHNQYNIIVGNPTAWYVTDKADGLRKIIYVNAGQIKAIDNEEKNIGETKNTNQIILDSEYIEETNMYFVFDLLYYQESLINFPYNIRLEYLNDIISDLHPNIKLKRIRKLSSEVSSEVKTKSSKSSEVSEASRVIKELMSSPDYKTDGLIFTPDSAYTDSPYKWKPKNQTTVDLLAVKALTQHGSQTTYWLFCGISGQYYQMFNMAQPKGYRKLFEYIPTSSRYFPVRFQPSIWPAAYIFKSSRQDLHMQILELLPMEVDNTLEWKLERIRTDRASDILAGGYYGNNFRTAETNLTSIFCGIDKKTIINFQPLTGGYFEIHDNSAYKAQRTAMNKVKDKLFELISEDNRDTELTYVLDLGIGKFQDIHRYRRQQYIKNVVGIEVDNYAVCEAVDRKFTISKDVKLGIGLYLGSALDRDLISNMEKFGLPTTDCYQAIICNLAIHYFMTKKSKFQKFLRTLNKFLHRARHLTRTFLVSFLDGRKIFDLLDDKKEYCIGDGSKYKFIKKYTSVSFVGYNQTIELKLPFTSSLREETLVNTDSLISEVKSYLGLDVKYSGSFGDDHCIELYQYLHALTPEDREFISLYSYIIFQSN
jgi:hypothetical protein